MQTTYQLTAIGRRGNRWQLGRFVAADRDEAINEANRRTALHFDGSITITPQDGGRPIVLDRAA